MKHFLFYLTFSLIIFSGSTLYAQAIKPCATVNGLLPNAGSPKFKYKCENQSVKLSVKNCGTAVMDPNDFSYQWINTSSPTPFTYPLRELNTDEKGIWVTTITDLVFGTVYKDTVELLNYNPPTIVLSINGGAAVLSHCSYETSAFTATVDNQYIPTSYKWFINNTSTKDTTVAVAGTGTSYSVIIPSDKWVTVMAADVNGCRSTDNIYAPLKTTPTPPNLGVDQLKCAGQSIKLKAYSITPPPSPDSLNYRYSWNGGGLTASSSYSSTTTGKNWVTVSIPSNITSCSASDTIYLSDYPAPNFTVSNDTSLCYQAHGPLHAKSASSLTYTWTPATYFPGGNTGANPVIDFNGVGLGTYIISVTATSSTSCPATKTLSVTHLGQGSNPYMSVTIDPLTICEGSTKAFNTLATTTYPNGPLKFQWTPGTYLDQDNKKNPVVDLTGSSVNTPVNYSVKVTDDNNCYITVSTSATLSASVAASVGFSDSSICAGNAITLQSSGSGGTGALTYTWSPATDLNTSTVANPVTTPSANRLYTITVSDTKGCSDSKTVNVKAINVIVKLLSRDTSGYNVEPMVLNPIVNSTTYTYQWTNETTLTTLGTDKSQLVTETGTYSVFAQEPASGCFATDTIDVTIQAGNPRLIYVPNVLNPVSANTENKTVKVYGTAVQENDFTFRIYNKWGEMIYETTSFTDANTNGWNGVYKTSNGTEENLSVYTYSLHGRYFDGQEFDKTGSITLIR